MDDRYADDLIAWTASGSGPPILLLHSLGGSGAMWASTRRRLERTHTVVTIDARGHGGSADEGFITVEQFATDAVHLLRRLDLGPAVVVGLSMGGQAAMHMALAAPELIRALVLADTSLGGRGDPDARVAALRKRLAEIGPDAFADEYTRSRLRPETSPETAAMFAGLVRRTLPEAYVRQSHSIGSQDLRAAAPAIRCPTLVLVGAFDVSTPPDLAEDLRRAIPGAGLTVIADANHLSNLDRPGAFDDAVAAFLAALLGNGSLRGSTAFSV